jgi:hypothetical protein
MPRGDRTGPLGAGPRSGRGLGYCGGADTPGFDSRLDWRRGRGGGFGWRHRFFATGRAGWDVPRYALPAREETLADLKTEADWLKGQLDAVNKRIEEMEK